MNEVLLAVLATLFGTLIVDGQARPRGARSLYLFRTGASTWLLILMSAGVFGTVLAFSGNTILSALISIALHLLLVVASNAKRRMLGEPLLFSDLALVAAVFRHPQFYFSALAGWQKATGLIVAMSLIVAMVLSFELTPLMHIAGASIAAISLAAFGLTLRIPSFQTLVTKPQIEDDVTRLGLLPTLFLYWWRWRSGEGGTAELHGSNIVVRSEVGGAPDAQDTPHVIIAVQCESFADPVELFGDRSYALPGLASARDEASQWGNLLVSGFGAYTMRTEYGVLFGREEEVLGFRRYDPFLTAREDAEWAIPHRLGFDNWRSLFVHPHDMRFYNRHQILPKAGFVELIGGDAFDPPSPSQGRYVTDAAIARKILELAETARSRTFIYAVTIENHGPWSASGKTGPDALMQNYNQLVRAGDEMLQQIRKGLQALGKPSTFAFFGDHRPSIPGVSEPGGDRHTPYVIMQYDAAGQPVTDNRIRANITPAQLHHSILQLSGLATTR